MVFLLAALVFSTVANVYSLCRDWQQCFQTMIPFAFLPVIIWISLVILLAKYRPQWLAAKPWWLFMVMYITCQFGYEQLVDASVVSGFEFLPFVFQGLLMIIAITALPAYDIRTVAGNALLVGACKLGVFGSFILDRSALAAICSTVIEMAIGAFVSTLILRSRCSAYYLKSIFHVIYDAITNKRPIDVSEYLPDDMTHKDRKVTITVMFLDIVSYSLLNDKLGEDKLTGAITRVYEEINKIVHHFGGRIDKSLGDGLLIYFKDPNQAVAAGQQIQLTTLGNGIRDRLVLPLRIGINTAVVLSKNMGDNKRIDVTMMGEGVIMAQRLESACNPYCIMLGAGTFEALIPEQKEHLAGHECQIQIKHSPQPLTAWQYDPFLSSRNLLMLADKLFWDAIGKNIKKPRAPVAAATITLHSPYGDFEVRDFSEFGFGVFAPVMLGRGFQLPLGIGGNERLEEDLAQRLLHEVLAEVVWSRISTTGRIKMGLQIIGRNSKEWQVIEAMINASIAASEAPHKVDIAT